MNWLLLLTMAHATETLLIAENEDWAYLDSATPPDSSWNTAGYDDSAWLSGPAPIGYGLFDLITLTDWGADPFDRPLTTWLRHDFTATGVTTFTGLVLKLRVDDGAVVYLNGAELHRVNMPAGVITDTTAALLSVSGAAQTDLVSYVVPVGGLIEGDNTLAVEVHNASINSPDLAFNLSLAAWDDAGSVIRGPYLQAANDDGLIVRWRTEGPSSSRVWTGSAPGALNVTHNSVGQSLDHEVQLTGLGPSNTQYYAVGSSETGMLAGDDADHFFTTHPTPGTRQPSRIWVLGDAGTKNISQEAVRDAFVTWSGTNNPDLLLMLGDNAYNSGTDTEYQLAMFDIYPSYLRRMATWSTIGNHEGYTSNSITQEGPYFDIFNLPINGESGGVPSGTEAWYSFDYANIHFVCLDSNGSDRGVGSAQLAWLELDLAATTQDWVVAFFHHPPYSRGSHNSDFETQLVEMRSNALPVLEDYGVDLVMSGHSHTYERSALADGHYGLANTFEANMWVHEGDGDPTGDGAYRKPTAGIAGHEGAVYVVAGSSGQVSGGSLDHPMMHLSLSELGSVVLDIDGDELNAVFLNDQGLELDHFSIHKAVTTITEIGGPRIGFETDSLDFTATAQHADGTPITDFEWDFGDGSPTEIGSAVSHTWSNDAAYRLTVTVQDLVGADVVEFATVDIQNAPPVVQPLIPPEKCDEGVEVAFHGDATDPANDPITYSWDMGDGALVAGQDIVYAFPDDGPWTVTLTVTDDAGAFASQSTQVTCTNLAPVLQGLAHAPLGENADATITAIVTDPGRDDTFTITWDVGLGITPFVGDIWEYHFGDAGDYPVTLTIEDDDGAIIVEDVVVTVSNGPPVIEVLSAPIAVYEGDLAHFSVVAYDPSNDPFTASWNFDDGSEAMGVSLSHAWSDDGLYVVRLTLDDGRIDGAEDHDLPVEVFNLPPVIQGTTVAGLLVEGETIALTANASDPGLNDELSYSWQVQGQLIEGNVATWIPDQDGLVQFTVTVTDDDGASAQTTVAAAIANGAPWLADTPPTLEAPVNDDWTWSTQVNDPGNDPIHYNLTGPDGSWVSESGEVHWIPELADEGQTMWFLLSFADDEGLGESFSWPVTVTAPITGEHTNFRNARGCSQAPMAPVLGWFLPLLLLWRRRSP
ncbi:MAG: PKD domain-containing protein [Rhodobacterales bacterium]|nr:PKD domain-containing protein [Rhodobacterales bacterium]